LERNTLKRLPIILPEELPSREVERLHQTFDPTAFRSLSREQIRVRTRSREAHFVVSHLIDQQPIRFDMAVPISLPLAFERMCPIRRRERLAQLQFPDYRGKL
jgi:hypothetical protein